MPAPFRGQSVGFSNNSTEPGLVLTCCTGFYWVLPSFTGFSLLYRTLLETIHRGALEQVYCGLSEACDALWRCPVTSLAALPSQWLQTTLEQVCSLDSHFGRVSRRVTFCFSNQSIFFSFLLGSQMRSGADGLCATRRSAGLPFLFQALLAPLVSMADPASQRVRFLPSFTEFYRVLPSFTEFVVPAPPHVLYFGNGRRC